MITFSPMSLNVSQIQMIQQSWRLLRDIDPHLVGDLFYSKLFYDHPEARALFPEDMSSQHQKLITMINVVIARLDQIDQMMPEILAMAQRHISYGTLRVHYDWVGSALLWTLRRALGDGWTPELEQAWAQCYGLLSDAMKSIYRSKTDK
jgi:hemoglobin-like flavoprotein